VARGQAPRGFTPSPDSYSLSSTLTFASGERSDAARSRRSTSRPVGRYLFASRALVTQFERRGYPNGYVWGEAIQQLHGESCERRSPRRAGYPCLIGA
jgi:hypothetical protein